MVVLLLKVGYGRNHMEAGKAIRRAPDEGIDGIISGNCLNLETIYIRAKCWTSSVGRPELKKFVGA